MPPSVGRQPPAPDAASRESELASRFLSSAGADGVASRWPLIAGFVAALALLAAVTWMGWRQSVRVQETQAWVARTYEVQAELNRWLALMEDIGTTERGFVIAGDPLFLESFESAVIATAEQQRRLEQLIADDEQKRALSALEPLIAEMIAVSRRNMELRRKLGFKAPQQAVAEGKGETVMDEIHARLGSMDARQRRLLDQRSAAARREASRVRLLSVSGTVLSCAVLIAVFALVLRENRLRQQANLALREREEMFRSFFELSADLVCISDIVGGRFLRINESFSRVLGYSQDELLTTPLIDFIHPDDRDSTSQVIKEQLERGEIVLSFENRFLRRDGNSVRLEWSAQPIPEKGLSFGIARDVTVRREAEELINELNRELLERASQLEEANEELESFSYSVSHDLRAPLRHIQGYADMLATDAAEQLSGEARRYLKTITNASAEMSQLIDDLLAFSRMGRVGIHVGPCRLDHLVQKSIRDLETATAGRSVAWKIGPLPEVRGDPSMLQQVFANLIGNAVKYTRQRDAAEIEIGCDGEEGGRVILFVRDNGAGFDMKYVHKLFGVFQRLHRADEFEGTGIGLAIVKRIITRHGGRTWAEGAPNQGATVYFTLKLAQSN